MLKTVKKCWDNKWLLRAMISGRAPRPTSAIIDPVNLCNLHCPFCPTGSGNQRLNQRMMKLDEFKLILDKLPFLKDLCLHNWGEPLLNPALPEMIGYAKGKGLTVSFDSNLALPLSVGRAGAIVASGLDNLTVSLDGASQESYGQYRRGGEFNRVIDNIRLLAETKKRLGVKHPLITWKFIVNRFNEPEIEQARRMANAMGVVFNLSQMGIPENLQQEWAPSEPYRLIKRKGISYPRAICIWLFRFVVVNSDGSVLPCCHISDNKFAYGNLLGQSFDDIWNGVQYRRSRRFMVPVLFPPRVASTTPCSTCRAYSTLAGAIRTRIADAWAPSTMTRSSPSTPGPPARKS